MRYWTIMAAKCAVAVAVLYAVWAGMHSLYTPPAHVLRWGFSPFLHDLKWTSMVFAFFLLCQAAIFTIVRDQRRRCRTCGRRLRMPVSHGRYGQMLLFGRPRTEYICSWGHGTLVQPELHLSGLEPSDWKAHDDDIWKELYELEQSGDKR